jgi:hypothetical protein
MPVTTSKSREEVRLLVHSRNIGYSNAMGLLLARDAMWSGNEIYAMNTGREDEKGGRAILYGSST